MVTDWCSSRRTEGLGDVIEEDVICHLPVALTVYLVYFCDREPHSREPVILIGRLLMMFRVEGGCVRTRHTESFADTLYKMF